MTLRFLNLLASLVMLWCAQNALSQGSGQAAFEKGYQAYMRNQFPIAENHFRQAYKNAATPEDKGFILKFMGISQFMRGDKNSAAKSFKEAVTMDPTLAVFAEEVLDPSVIKFFEGVKLKTLQEVAVKSSGTPPPNSMSATELIDQSDKSSQPEVTEKKKKKKKKKKKRKKRKKRKKKKKTVEEEGGFSFAHLLPFGVPQFYNGEYIIGSIYSTAQLATIGLGLARQAEVAAEEDENAKVLADDTLDQGTKDNFIEKNNAFISSLEQDAQSAFIGFGLIYTTSIIHGIVSAPSPEAKKTGYRRADDSDSLVHVNRRNVDTSYSLNVMPYKKGWAILVSTRF